MLACAIVFLPAAATRRIPRADKASPETIQGNKEKRFYEGMQKRRDPEKKSKSRRRKVGICPNHEPELQTEFITRCWLEGFGGSGRCCQRGLKYADVSTRRWWKVRFGVFLVWRSITARSAKPTCPAAPLAFLPAMSFGNYYRAMVEPPKPLGKNACRY
jgi:hypothetical protein